MIGSAAKHPRAPPNEILVRSSAKGVGGDHPWTEVSVLLYDVRFALDHPASIDGGVVKSERFVGCCSASQWSLDKRAEHGRFGDRIVITAGLEHENIGARHGQDVRALAAGSSRTDNDDIVRRPALAAGDDGHRAIMRGKIKQSILSG